MFLSLRHFGFFGAGLVVFKVKDDFVIIIQINMDKAACCELAEQKLFGERAFDLFLNNAR